MNTLDRFNAKTTPANDGTGCILWTASRLPKGYGIFGHDGQYLAHRWIYAHTHGVKLGRWDFVLHSCDRPACVNVAHLRVGTAKENTADMDARGRRVALGAPGERNAKARLTVAQVAEIRSRRTAGEKGVDLAQEFAVSTSTISAIFTGRIWQVAA